MGPLQKWFGFYIAVNVMALKGAMIGDNTRNAWLDEQDVFLNYLSSNKELYVVHKK